MKVKHCEIMICVRCLHIIISIFHIPLLRFSVDSYTYILRCGLTISHCHINSCNNEITIKQSDFENWCLTFYQYVPCLMLLNSLVPGDLFNFQISNFQANFGLLMAEVCLAKLLSVDSHWTSLIKVSVGSGNGLVPSGNKPLPEPMLTQIYVTIWHHSATIG